jgi:hypothetical protein
MADAAHAIDPDALARARALTARRARASSMWPVLAAAAALAISAIVFATVMVTAPPLTREHPAQARSID